MKKVNKNTNGTKKNVSNVIENVLNNSVLQPTLDNLTASEIFALKEKKNIQFSKVETVVKVQPPKQIETVIITEEQYQQFQKFGVATELKTGQKLDKSTFDIHVQDLRKAIHIAAIEKARKGSTSIKIIEYDQTWLKTFNRSFVTKEITEKGASFFERYYANELTKDDLRNINFKMFNNSFVVRLETPELISKLGGETCYCKIEENCLHLFTDKKEYRILYKRVNLIKYKTNEAFLNCYGMQIDNTDLQYKRTDFGKFLKQVSDKLATETIQSNLVGEFITDYKLSSKINSSIKKQLKDSNVITEVPTVWK